MKKSITTAVLASLVLVLASCGTDAPVQETVTPVDSCAVKCDTVKCDTTAAVKVDTLATAK